MDLHKIRPTSEIVFKTIELERDFAHAYKFFRNASVVSFGRELEGLKGKKEYFDHLQKNIGEKNFGAYHIWMNGYIVGQIELSLFKEDTSWGYVNLYYLIEKLRGQGYGKQLDIFAQSFFLDRNIYRAKLNVSPTNVHAVKFYKKQGWIDKGPTIFPVGHFLYGLLHTMEKIFR